MLLYPWLNDLRHTDRFTEHGHRLAGMVIGLTSILLTVVTFVWEKQKWVRWYSVGILAAVIAQGLLGGARVLMDANVLALIHSITGALFFSLCVVFAVLTGPGWQQNSRRRSRLSPWAAVGVMLFPVLVVVQYLLGGLFRHLGLMMFEHLAGAVVVAVTGGACAALLMASAEPAEVRSGRRILAALLLQLGLGIGAWVTKLNVPALGWVVATGAPTAVILRSAHTIGGMLLLTASVLAAVQTARTFSWLRIPDLLPEESGRSQEGLA